MIKTQNRPFRIAGMEPTLGVRTAKYCVRVFATGTQGYYTTLHRGTDLLTDDPDTNKKAVKGAKEAP